MRYRRALAALTVLAIAAAQAQGDTPSPTTPTEPTPGTLGSPENPIVLQPDAPAEPTTTSRQSAPAQKPAVPAPVQKPANPKPTKPVAPAPAKPASPAPQKAPAKPAAPKGLSLLVSAPEGRIKGGKLETIINSKRIPLDGDLVARSRQYGKISTQLEPALATVFASLQREPQDARFVQQDGEWVALQRSQWRVDEAASRANLLAAIKGGKGESEIALEVTPPSVNVAALAKQGIVTRYGGGSSNYGGSPSFRVTNILAGARLLDGVIIPKGGVFDFNATVGPTSSDSGFVPGYVISGGTLALELGGGICQVSTTIFRAAYNAGLPIVERHNHSYRVHYYDPVGFEATVYAPYKNLRFKNDSPAALFIQMTNDPRRQTLSFDLFGSAPDRTTVVSDPVILSVTPAPGARFIADAGVPLGHAYRVDSAEVGRKVLITRTVKLAGGEVRRDELRSNYVPWGAIYRVNPADPRAPQPQDQAAGKGKARQGG